MAPSRHFLWLAALLAPSVVAQAGDRLLVWSSVSYVFYGERSPPQGFALPALTSNGAQQLYAQGSLFRSRYLQRDNYTQQQAAVTERATIQNLEPDVLDNSQLYMAASADAYTGGSALAFVQGLYPPVAQGADGSFTEFPLGGYQYPNLRAMSMQDPDSVGLQGQISCVKYMQSGLDFLEESQAQQMYNSTLPTYQKLWQSYFRQDGTFALSDVNYWNAYQLWEYAAYQYKYDNLTRAALVSADIEFLRGMANMQQQGLNGNVSASGNVQGDMIRAVAGQTLAAKIVTLFESHISTGGRRNKLNLLFGSFEPFLAFFALSHLAGGPSSATFAQLPQPGAAMIFELVSNGNDSSVLPPRANLQVRFYYRNSTDPAARFLAYPLFGNGNSQLRMLYNDFTAAMHDVSIPSQGSWCNTCNATTVFCTGLLRNFANPGLGNDAGQTACANNEQASPFVGGIIGAALTLFIFGFVMAARRFHKFVRQEAQKAQTATRAQGPKRMEPDADVTYARNGVRHERVGSWELGGPGSVKEVEAGIASMVAPVPTAARSSSAYDLRRSRDDDEASEMGRKAVVPHEQV